MDRNRVRGNSRRIKISPWFASSRCGRDFPAISIVCIYACQMEIETIHNSTNDPHPARLFYIFSGCVAKNIRGTSPIIAQIIKTQPVKRYLYHPPVGTGLSSGSQRGWANRGESCKLSHECSDFSSFFCNHIISYNVEHVYLAVLQGNWFIYFSTDWRVSASVSICTYQNETYF